MLFALIARPQAATTKTIAPLPHRTPARQATQADVIVVGKVNQIEKEFSEATPNPGDMTKVIYHIAVVNISEGILGAKGLTSIRVGWQPLQVNPQGANIPRKGIPEATLTEGQEGVFFLLKHHEGDFYILIRYGQPLDKKAPDYESQLQSVKKIVKVIEDPVASLKAKEAGDRLFASAVLLHKYRTYVQTGGKMPVEQNIPAEQSKLILSAIAEAPWGKSEFYEGIQIGAPGLFQMLRVQANQFGFDPPKSMLGQDYQMAYGEYVKKWIKQNGDAYRIQRWVYEK